MGTKHTPGPWEVDDDGEVSSQNVVVAKVFQWDDFPCLEEHMEAVQRECEANARLIAAAPELLAALHELDAMYQRIAPDDPEGLHPDLHPAWKACKAAIAKAT
jgi:hypothetical protein